MEMVEDLQIPELLFVDDMVLVVGGEEELEIIVGKVKDNC
jgi:hypothetical protein